MTRKRAHHSNALGSFALFVAVLSVLIALATPCALASTSPLFLPAVTYPSGGHLALSIAVADLNGDGRPDLVVANCASIGPSGCEGGLGVLLGNGDGTFQSPVSYRSGGIRTFSVAIADVNRDGRLDLIATNVCADSTCTRGSVGVLLGNGDGTFNEATNFDVGGREAFSVAIADVDGDGNPDLVVARCGTSSCSENGSRNGKVGVLLGNGDGSFKAAVSYDSGGTIAVSVAIADVNGDDKPDILVASCGPLGADSCNEERGVLGVLLGNGDGSFLAAVSYDSGGYGATSVAISDVNGDGKPDVLVGNCGKFEGCGGIGSVGVLLGNGDGTFKAPVSYDSGGNDTTSVAVADVNGDGKPDLLVANFTVDPGQDAGAMGVLLGNGDGTFQPAATYNAGGIDAWSVAVADVNGDSKPDGLVAQTCAAITNCLGGVVGVLVNNTPLDTTPPVITLSATPRVLWAPNGRVVPVTVSGTITDTGSGVNATTAAYAVTDEYGEIQPTGAITLSPEGNYSFTVLLQASRRGSDLNGRRYTVTVRAKDNAGNGGSKASAVTVPHDQGD